MNRLPMGRAMVACAALALLAPGVHGADPLYGSARRKLDLIEAGKIVRGGSVYLSLAEINAWAKYRIPELIPEGIRGQRLEIGTDVATGYAQIDFLKLRHAQGQSTGWLLTKMIEGERPVKVSLRVRSAGGKCTVDLTRVQIGVAVASGGLLDLLIKNFFLPLYPDAKIGQPFDLDYDMDRIEVRPSGVRVVIKH